MASLLTTTSSQVQADVTAAPGHTATITDMTLQPFPGSARKLEINLVIDQGGGNQFNLTLDIVFRDEGFEEFNIFGGRKGGGQVTGGVT